MTLYDRTWVKIDLSLLQYLTGGVSDVFDPNNIGNYTYVAIWDGGEKDETFQK